MPSKDREYIGVDVDKMPRFLDVQLHATAAPASSAPTKPFE